MRAAAVREVADQLLLDAVGDDQALIGPSVYENARVVAVAPWLEGHLERLRYLLAEQATDGGWGTAGFRLVPTLSATEALLRAPGPACAAAAERGLAVLARWLAPGSTAEPLPDTVAVELVVPALVEALADRLPAVVLPTGTDPAALARLRATVAAGHPIPPKLWHAWEVLSPGPRAQQVRPLAGSVSCSPAATAAWLGEPPGPADESGRWLAQLADRGDGVLPLGAPMPWFERAWILSILAVHGVPHQVPAGMLDNLDAAVGPDGMTPGPGLPPDADDTAVGLHALNRHGRRRRPDALLDYRSDGHFFTYPEERTASPTANAHAVEALIHWVSITPADRARYAAAVDDAAGWLLDTQRPDGSWVDKWNGSPYYATACCVRALTAHGDPRWRPGLHRAVKWVLDTEQPGHRWGHGAGTVEETAYAMLMLRHARPGTPGVAEALAAATRTVRDGEVTARSTPLWIGKDVYTPVRIVAATRLAALQATERSAGEH